jgi:hypothetical protein
MAVGTPTFYSLAPCAIPIRSWPTGCRLAAECDIAALLIRIQHADRMRDRRSPYLPNTFAWLKSDPSVFEVPRILCTLTAGGASICWEDRIQAVYAKELRRGGSVHHVDYIAARNVCLKRCRIAIENSPGHGRAIGMGHILVEKRVNHIFLDPCRTWARLCPSLPIPTYQKSFDSEITHDPASLIS